MKARLDRIYRLGEKPCWYKRPCDGCPNYVLMGTGILITKCAAIGDVVRMASFVAGLKKKYKNPHITWITDTAAETHAKRAVSRHHDCPSSRSSRKKSGR